MLSLRSVALFDFLKNTRCLSGIDEIVYELKPNEDPTKEDYYEVTMTATANLNISTLCTWAYMANLEEIATRENYLKFQKNIQESSVKQFVLRRNEITCETINSDEKKYSFFL